MIAENQQEMILSLAEIVDIWEAMKADFKRKFNSPLASNKTDEATIRAMAAKYSYVKFSAMWNYYLSACYSKGFAVSVENFLKPENLNKYAGQVRHIGRKQSDEIVECIGYYCENWPCMGESIMGKVIEQPLCYENPCPLCGGRLLRMTDAERYAMIINQGKVLADAKTERPKGSEVPGLRGVDGGGESGNSTMRPLSEVASQIIQPRMDEEAPGVDGGEECELDLSEDIEFF